ncbi:MAG: ATP:cob(I)alamin adenosyltransferase [Candidatus Taylorbacteria bacterium RIFCSPHIGHO2_01_FULL_51_15]|uniref:Corrinoid adenosyltransferase n=1 Tax=Candidatus Taylorbacteria bacterium RIFCSPHIGHO2_01_FULL_51_15 TaxID=1802304 RepID=A0A1G2MD45_9BACT|nr:MAG: ATP:cob(I)alamin adenosyltransferase [Candidatus Taylorbacteria bacterium RIFCSPHIGHO2_01_FULL_51_15]
MKYYTAKGDAGTTRLLGSEERTRLSKADEIFDVLGGVDELNSFVGFSRAVAERSSFEGSKRAQFIEALQSLQEGLFILQAELGGGSKRLSKHNVAHLEHMIARFADEFPPIHSFVIPGATELSALLDVSRAVARRVERRYVRSVTLRGFDGAITTAYLNRVSSLLYVLARYVNHVHHVPESAPSYH